MDLHQRANAKYYAGPLGTSQDPTGATARGYTVDETETDEPSGYKKRHGDRLLLAKLTAILDCHACETGESETVFQTLNRIVAERDKARESLEQLRALALRSTP